MARSHRPPRDDAQRSVRYDAHVIPLTVKGILTSRLTSMQAGYSAAAQRLADIQSLTAGVLSGYSIPPYTYARWYAYANQVDKLKRKFAGGPGLADELASLTCLWISRGYNAVILDQVRDSVLAYNITWSVTVPQTPIFPSVSAASGHVVYAANADKSIYFLDPVTRTVRTATLTTQPGFFPIYGNPLAVIGVPEMAATDTFATIDEATLTVTEHALTAGDEPQAASADYDPVLYGGTTKGYFAVPCGGAAKCLLVPMIPGTPVITIVTPKKLLFTLVDQATNSIWCTSAEENKLYRIDRTTHAVTSIALTFAPFGMAIDATNGKLWISSNAPDTKLVRMDTTTHALGAATTITDSLLVPVADPIRYKCYIAEPSVTKILCVDGAALTTDLLDASAFAGNLDIDPVACLLYWYDNSAGYTYKVHMLSKYQEAYATPGVYSIAADKQQHRLYIAQVAPDKLLTCIMP